MVKRQILIVSDDAELCLVIQLKLENDTTEVQCASSISTAVGNIMKSEYCLVMLDLQVSGVDKAEMIRIIRVMQHIPIMVISEHLESAEIVALYHAGIDTYMEKPLNSDICVAQIQALITLCLRAAEKCGNRPLLRLGHHWLSAHITGRYRLMEHL